MKCGIQYIDRQTGRQEIEAVYGGEAIKWLYANMPTPPKRKSLQLVNLLAKLPAISALYGWWQRRPWSKRKIVPFIQKFHIDTAEFQDSVDSFGSFDDFFIRKLKREARPLPHEKGLAVIPADGRYRFIPNIAHADGFIVKGQKFSLAELLGDAALAQSYEQGSMVMARLCPIDYHRFHFPCDGLPGPSRLIDGDLYSVNPLALSKNIHIYTQNKRRITAIESRSFGKILYVEVGATNVGSIHETYTPNLPYHTGDEKGYFSFGGSALLLLFEPNTIEFEPDLLHLSGRGLEIYCKMGQPLGRPQ